METSIFDSQASQVLSGIDSLYVTANYSYLDGQSPLLFPIFDQLEKLKLRAREERQPQVLQVYDEQVLVQGYGSRFYAYIVQSKSYNIQISKHISASIPSLNIQIRSYALWLLGLEGAIKQLEQLLFNLGLYGPYHFKPSRLDLCCDVLSKNFLPYLSNYAVTRSRKKQTITDCDKPIYVRYGKGAFQVRFYDKHQEIKNSQKLFFYDLWNLDPSNLPENKSVYRIEYQLRREALKEFSINSMNDLIDNLSEVWNYLTTSWCKICYPQKNRNKAREKVTPFWESIQGEFKANLTYPALRKKMAIEVEGKQLAQAMVGMVLRYASLSLDDYDQGLKGVELTRDSFVSTCRDMLLKSGMTETELQSRFISKII